MICVMLIMICDHDPVTYPTSSDPLHLLKFVHFVSKFVLIPSDSHSLQTHHNYKYNWYSSLRCSIHHIQYTIDMMWSTRVFKRHNDQQNGEIYETVIHSVISVTPVELQIIYLPLIKWHYNIPTHNTCWCTLKCVESMNVSVQFSTLDN